MDVRWAVVIDVGGGCMLEMVTCSSCGLDTRVVVDALVGLGLEAAKHNRQIM
jgi:NAD(P)H-hydrate repair Nnr-like enzyme with NAD(P)H-hydrate epimerase domain